MFLSTFKTRSKKNEQHRKSASKDAGSDTVTVGAEVGCMEDVSCGDTLEGLKPVVEVAMPADEDEIAAMLSCLDYNDIFADKDDIFNDNNVAVYYHHKNADIKLTIISAPHNIVTTTAQATSAMVLSSPSSSDSDDEDVYHDDDEEEDVRDACRPECNKQGAAGEQEDDKEIPHSRGNNTLQVPSQSAVGDTPLRTSKHSRPGLKILPTLDEKSTHNDIEITKASLSSNSLHKFSSSTHSKKPYVPKSNKPSRLERLNKYTSRAADFAQRGDEQQAIKAYKHALCIAGKELARIRSQISKRPHLKSNYSDSGPLPEAALKSIQNRIQEDLLTISEKTGKIRRTLAILYERASDYDKAIECCSEAQTFYKYKNDFTCKQRANNLTITPTNHDRYKDTIKMMQRLENAKTCMELRQQSFQEMSDIRNDIFLLDCPSSSMTAEQKLRTKTRLLDRLYNIAVIQLKTETCALGKSHPQIADILQVCAALAQEQKCTGDLIQYLQNALKVTKSSYGMKHPKTAQLYIQLARIYGSLSIDPASPSNNEDVVLEYFQSAATILCASRLMPSLLGATLNDIAIIYMKRRDFTSAIDLLKDALAQYEGNAESLRTSVVIDLQGGRNKGSFSSTCSNNERTEEVETGNDPSSGSTMSNSSSDDSAMFSSSTIMPGNLSIDALQVWRNLGESYYQVKQYNKAKNAYFNALEIQRSTRKLHDAVTDLDLGIVSVQDGMIKLVDDASIVDTLSRLGRACAASYKHHDAMVAFKESLELMNRIAVEEELFGELTNKEVRMRRQALSKTLFSIASSCSEIADYTGALKYYGESIQNSRLCASSSWQMDPDKAVEHKQITLSNAAHCGLCFIGIADVHIKQGKYPEALKVYNDAFKYCQKKGLTREHPVIVSILEKKKEAENWITELPRSNAEVASLEARALDEMNAGQLDDSILTLTEAMGILRSSFTQAQLAGFDSSEHLCAISRMLRTLAKVFLEKGEEQKAERLFQDAVRLFQQSGSEETLEC